MNFVRLTQRLALALTLTTAAGATAAARDYEDAVRVGLKGAFGLGGEGTSEVDGYYGESDDDLEPTVGFALFGAYPLHRYFHLGLQTAFSWAISETADNYNAGRTFVLDIAAVPKLRVPLAQDKLELSLSVPVGLTVSVPPDDQVYGLGEVDTGVGYNIGVMAGVGYRVYDGLTLQAELGWQGRGTSNDTQYGAEISTSMSQFALSFGFSYAL